LKNLLSGDQAHN